MVHSAEVHVKTSHVQDPQPFGHVKLHDGPLQGAQAQALAPEEPDVPLVPEEPDVPLVPLVPLVPDDELPPPSAKSPSKSRPHPMDARRAKATVVSASTLAALDAGTATTSRRD